MLDGLKGQLPKNCARQVGQDLAKNNVFGTPVKSGTCELRQRLTDSFGLIPDAKPQKWRLARLHGEKIRVRRMGFLN
jgi:hypothetical protein